MYRKLFLFAALLFSLFLTAQTTKKEVQLHELLKKVNLEYLQNESKAQRTLDSLQPILIQKANDSLLGLYYRVCSSVKSNQLNKKSALRDIDQSIAYYKKAKNQKGIVLSTMNKGNIFLIKGDTKLAMTNYTNALSIAKKYSLDLEMGWLYKNIGVVFYNQNKTQEALRHYDKSLAQFLKINNKKEIASVYTNIGNVYYNEYDSKNALLNYKKAVAMAAEVRDTINLAKLYNNIGSVYVSDEKDTIKGLPYLLRSLELKVKMNDKNDLIFQYENIATVYIGLKQYDIAENYLKKSYAMAMKSGNKENLKEVYEDYALIYAGKKDYKKAYDYFRLHAKVKDTLLNIENLKAVEEIKTKYQTSEKEKIILQNEIDSKRKNNWLITISLLAVFTALIGFLIYRQQKLKNQQQEQEFQLKSAIAAIESQNKLQEQRLSISRDLHDNIGAQLTFVISSVDNLKYGNQITDKKITNQLTKISDFTKSTIIELRDTIWAMNTNEFSFDDLRSRIFNFIEKAKTAKEEVTFLFTIDEAELTTKLSSITGINIYRTIQEAVNNAIKYAHAHTIEVDVKHLKNSIRITVEDDGKGFDVATVNSGNGLQNMQKRIEDIGGKFTITSSEKGTKITILI